MFYPSPLIKSRHILTLLLLTAVPCWAQSTASSSSACSSSSAASSTSRPAVLQCTVHSTQPWDQGFNATVDVTNSSAQALDSWEVYLRLEEGHGINHHWNSVITSSNGVATAHNAHWNGSLQPGQTTSFGILGNHPGAYIEPACSVSPLPQANLTLQTYGLTVKASSLATAEKSTHQINFGDGTIFTASNAWHTYTAPGDYDITLTVSDGERQSSQTQTITVSDNNNDNHAPVAKLFYDVSAGNVSIASGLSYDPDGDTLTKERSRTQGDNYRIEVLTVFDGELGDTTSAYISTDCNSFYHASINADYTYSLNDHTLTVDARNSNGATLIWDFGDGSQSSNVITQHTYSEPGDYEVALTVSGYPHRETKYFNVTVGE